MKWEKSICLITLASLILVMAGCTKFGESVPSASEQTTHPEGWTEGTHSNNADPNYEVVFPQDEVNQINITIAPDDWEAMQANMTELLGPRGTGQPGAPGVRPCANPQPYFFSSEITIRQNVQPQVLDKRSPLF